MQPIYESRKSMSNGSCGNKEIYQQIISSLRRFLLRTGRWEDEGQQPGLSSSLRDAPSGPALAGTAGSWLFICVLGSLSPLHTVRINPEELLTLLTDCSLFVSLQLDSNCLGPGTTSCTPLSASAVDG